MVLEGIEFGSVRRRRRRWRSRAGHEKGFYDRNSSSPWHSSERTLPDDPVLLRGVMSQLLGAVGSSSAKTPGFGLRWKRSSRKLFRQRTEKLDPRQLELVFEAMQDLGIPQGQLEQLDRQEVLGKGRRRGSSGRQPLPKALPRERIEHALPEQERCCTACGVELTKIREEVTEQLDYLRLPSRSSSTCAVFACKSCEETMVRAPKPAQAIEKGLPGPGLLAQVVVSKYADHQPLYRQAQIYGRHGVTLVALDAFAVGLQRRPRLVSPPRRLDAARSVAIAHRSNRRHTGHGARRPGRNAQRQSSGSTLATAGIRTSSTTSRRPARAADRLDS